MNMQEYKDRKDALRRDIENLVREFNQDTETVILSLDIDMYLSRSIDDKNPSMIGFKCNITTELDR